MRLHGSVTALARWLGLALLAALTGLPAFAQETGVSDDTPLALALDRYGAGDLRPAYERAREAMRSGGLTPSEAETGRQILAACVFVGLVRESNDRYDPYWLAQAETLSPPTKVESSGGWSFGYATLAVADDAANRGDWEKATRFFLTGKPYATSGYRNAALTEAIAGMRTVAQSMEERIAARGFQVGSYVCNQGTLLRWIARVVAIDGDVLLVRYTYVETPTTEMKPGREVRLASAQAKVLTALSVDAVLKGWR